MPELPEVETIKRGLNKFVIQQKIKKVEVLCDKSFIGPTQLVEGAKIVEVRRRGKCLLVDLSNDVTMMIHLRMTGQVIYRSNGSEKGADIMEVAKKQTLSDETSFAGGHPTDSFFTELPNKQTRVIFTLEKGTIFFNDQRKFGFVKVLPTVEVEREKFIASLGAEPWEMDADEFYNKLQRHGKSPIKAVILDQKVMAGVGNIYADEALFEIKVHPKTLAGDLDRKQAEALVKAAAKVMDASINSGGSTMATYVRADGTKGNYLELFAQVFRREGQPCKRCGHEIEKIRVAGRGTHICPECQKLC